jgi:integration host factor subunit beta
MSDNSYTRSDLAADLSHKEGCSIEKARGTIENIIKAVSGALAIGRKVEFRGFGVLEVTRRKEKVGRNPKAPEQGTYRIPPRNVVKFRTGKELDETLNREGEAAVSA